MTDKKHSKYKRLMKGGPYNGLWMFLKTSGTMIFSVVLNDVSYKGMYDSDDNWMPIS